MEAEPRRKDAPHKPPTTHPLPEVPRRPATEDEIPPAAKRMIKLAEDNGWTVIVTYARGTTPAERAPHLVHSTALRMRRGGQFAVAVWTAPVMTGKWVFDFAACLGRWRHYVKGLDVLMPIKMSSADVKMFIKSPS